MKMRCWLAVLVGAWSLTASATTVIECEHFDNLGGWQLDTQFMDQMGSAYLIAHGLGKPVENARTGFDVSVAGRYAVWARTRNWTRPWSDVAAGRFQVLVDGADSGVVLGQGAEAWGYELAGVFELSAGRHRLELRDLTGFDGRCDRICLQWLEGSEPTPPEDERTLCGAAAKTVTADLVVVGGGIAGICTAVSAARLGLSVALVQDRPLLGGNNSSEVRVHLGAWQNMPPYPRLGDVLAEFGPERGGNAQSAETYEDERKLAIVRAETNIVLRLNERVCSLEGGVGPDGTNRIARVRSVNVRTGAVTDYRATWFADCTGDGALGFLAGADWRMGREAKSETGEPWAPERADMKTMGASIQWRAERREGKECGFPLQDWMIRFDETNGRAEMKGDWDWEAGIGRDQVREAERIRDYGLLVAYSNWAYVKNVSGKKNEFRDAELDWVAYVAGRRESRRLMGDFVLTERQIVNREYQEDGTASASWTIDLHLPKTKDETGFAGEPFRANSENEKIWPHPVPYRCLYSRNVPNLFMSGRDISVTHIALGTTRLMRTIGMLGEVVGMAASVCKRHGCDPRAVYTDHLDELKALMTRGVGDGHAHPLQMYNLQNSLDPRYRDHRAGNCQVRGLMVDDRLPAGNIVFEKAEGDTVYVRQDVRDTKGSWYWGWFYWGMRVRGAAGRTLTFKFTHGEVVGVRGPVVSLDRGKSFAYPLDGKSTVTGFTYAFADDADEVWFYECHPYVRADWDAFVSRHATVRGNRFVTETLCRSRKGADVPCARFGCIDRAPRYRVFMSARHHCSETAASWVLEGVAEAFLAEDDLGRWLRENVELMMVPMTDYDGVQAGDQGKSRAPHDHNRDYSEFIYPETKAITEWIGCHAGGKLDIFIDVHCPWIRGKYNEWLYTPWKDPKILPSAADEKRYSELLEKLQCGTMRYRAADDLPFGKEWNRGVNYAQGWSAVIWACHRVKGLRIARSYEVPFANANGAVVTPETCREFGRDTAKVFRAFFTGDTGLPRCVDGVSPHPESVGGTAASRLSRASIVGVPLAGLTECSCQDT